MLKKPPKSSWQHRNFQPCLLPKMRLSVVLVDRYTGYEWPNQNTDIFFISKSLILSSNSPFSRDRCVVISKLFISVSDQFLLHSGRLVAMAVINLHFQGGPPLSSSRQSLVGCLSIPFHLLIGNLQLPSGQSAGRCISRWWKYRETVWWWKYHETVWCWNSL